MANFFPPDVRVFVDGYQEGAGPYYARTRNVLFKALNLQAAGMTLPIQLVQELGDGAVARVLLTGNQKIVQITVPFPAVPEQPVPTELGHPRRLWGMLSGWVRDSTLVVVNGITKLASWHPTSTTATAWKYLPTWQAVTRLGVTTATSAPEHHQILASKYSGAMKRWVQAILGMGIITDDSPAYLTGAAPSNPTRPIVCNYDWTFGKTHGIIKTGPKNHWLIEVSRANGVLAMPLPMLDSTKTARYAAAILSKGDTGTTAILNEFGGLPSGEMFPTSSTTINTYVTAGKILRLMTAVEIAPFYDGKTGYFPDCGWAFSETGKEIHNTCNSVEALDEETPLFSTGLFGEWWAIKVTLSAHNISNLPDNPVGTGHAELELQHKGQMDREALFNFFTPNGLGSTHPLYPACYVAGIDTINTVQRQDTTLIRSDDPDRSGYDVNDRFRAENDRWGATVYVFFIGDKLERMKWVPEKTITKGLQWDGTFVDTNMLGHCASMNYTGWFLDCRVCPFGVDALYEAKGPYWTIWSDFTATWSPSGFAGDHTELRVIDGINIDRNSAGPTEAQLAQLLSPNPGTWTVFPLVNTNNARAIFENGTNNCPTDIEVLGVNETLDDALAEKAPLDYGDPAGEGPRGVAKQRRTTFIAFVPVNCRESYVITQQTVTQTFFPTDETVEYLVHEIGFLGKVQIDFAPPEDEPRLPQLPPIYDGSQALGIYCAGAVNAGPSSQYVIDKGFYAYLETATRPVLRVGLPAGMETALPDGNTNWTGVV